MNSRHSITGLLLLALCAGTALAASDYAREQRWAEQIEDALIDGQAVRLDVSGQKVFAIYTEQTTGQPHGAVVLAHGLGAHPDWPEVIHPLRSRLPEHGWSTLSVQMPVLANGAPLRDYVSLFDEAGARLEAAHRFLQDRNAGPVALIGHSLGALMGLDYLTRTPQPPYRAFVAIGLASYPRIDARLDSVAALGRLNRPMLDLYGSEDLPTVLDTTRPRRNMAQKAVDKAAREAKEKQREALAAANTRQPEADDTMPVHYRQIVIAGADHFFSHQEDELVKRIRGWLERTLEKKPSD